MCGIWSRFIFLSICLHSLASLGLKCVLGLGSESIAGAAFGTKALLGQPAGAKEGASLTSPVVHTPQGELRCGMI